MTRRDLIGAWHRPQQALSAGLSHIRDGKDVDEVMIVLGADAHKRSHTVAAVQAATGQVLGDKTAAATARGFGPLLIWARGLDRDRVWALEDCRHVSGAFERFLIARGERVVRVSTRLMAGSRRSSRERGKSDRIDAISVARAALAAGIESLPTAALAGPELDLRLLVDHRERLVRARVALNSTLQWNLHDLWPELELAGGALFSAKWSSRIGRRLARAQQTMRVRIARDELRRLRELTASIKTLEAEIADLVGRLAPQLVSKPGCGPLTAAKLVGEIAGADRFASDAKLRPRRIRATVPEADIDELAQLPRVATVEPRGEVVSLICTDSDAAVRALLMQHPEASDIEIATTGLEEAFVELTGAECDHRRPRAEVPA